MARNAFERFLNQALNNPFDPKAKIINGIFTFLIVLSIAVLPLMFLPDDYGNAKENLMFFEKIIVSIFLAEYILRIWAADNPFKFIFSWEGIIDLIAILPFFFQKFGFFESTQMFVLLRLFRCFKFANVMDFDTISVTNLQNVSRANWRLLDGEEVVKIYMRHPIIFLANLVIPIFLTTIGMLIFITFPEARFIQIISVIMFLFAILFFTKAWLDLNLDILYITTYRVVVQDYNLFGATANGMRYESITNIIPDNRGILQFIFRMGNIAIETPAGMRTANFTYVARPYKIAGKIEEFREIALKKMGVRPQHLRDNA